MVRFFIMVSLMVFAFHDSLIAREDRRSVRQGNRYYNENNFQEAEIYYRRAIKNNPQNFPGVFNLGNALYRQNRYKEAAEAFGRIPESDLSDSQKAKAFHNLGNSHLSAGQYAESVEAFKNALRLNPGDNETRFNLAYAMQKLHQQQHSEQQNQQGNNRQQEQNQQNQPQAPQAGQDTQQPAQQSQGRLSPQEIDRILDALNKREQALQKELLNRKQKVQPFAHERDW